MTGIARRDRRTGGGQRANRRGPAPEPRKSQSTRRYDPADTRSRILESAYQLFAMHGYSTTGTADIAAQAGVSEGSIFYHFGSKHSLLVELGRLHGQKLVAAMQGDDSLDRLTLATSLDRAFDFFDQTYLACEADAGGAPKRRSEPEAETFIEAAKEILVDWMKRRLDSRPRAVSGDSELTARLIFATVGEAAQQYCQAGGTDEERRRIRAECVRFCSAAIGEA